MIGIVIPMPGLKKHLGKVIKGLIKSRGPVTIPGVGKQVRKVRSLDKDSFIYGIPSNKLQICPGCAKKTCYYKGVVPTAVKCLNHDCVWYEKPNIVNKENFDK